MKHSTITVIISGNTYRLAAHDSESISAMPNEDRQALLGLLERVKEQGAFVAPKSNAASFKNNNYTPINPEEINPKDMGKGDLDALAAQLIMKEKSNQKPTMTKQDLYKWIGGFTVVVIVLMLILS